MRPFLQVQPIHRDAYADALLNRVTVREADAMPPDLWQAYHDSLIDPVMFNPKRGHYAVTARKRRAGEDRCPMTGEREP